MKKLTGRIGALLLVAVMCFAFAGCSVFKEKDENDNVLSGNVVITETGEVIEKYPQPGEESGAQTVETPAPVAEGKDPEAQGEKPEAEDAKEENKEDTEEKKEQEKATPEIVKAEVELEVPVPEQVISEEEDQTEPKGHELQMVFLGDSIFDSYRDGTGVPYLTSVQFNADVYNLAIGGTSATLESGEPNDNSKWDSQSLVGVVKAMKGEVSTECFGQSRTREILDNKRIDWSETDYFIVEYGMNDFFRGVPLDNYDGNWYDVYTYAGALRYAASNLSEIAPDAEIIFCGPNYAQFFKNGAYIGDGNTVNTGYGTLFDYKGICQYVAGEYHDHFLDAYLDIGINGYTAKQYLEDGVHLSAEGRQLYADHLADKIAKLEETRNN